MARFLLRLLALCAPVATQTTECSTWYERANHSTTGVWRNAKDPRFAGGAKGDGVTDDTQAIQAALDYRRDDPGLKLTPGQRWTKVRTPGKAPAIVYLPPGEYLISDTLVIVFYTHLVGNFRCPPTIILKPNATGFTDRTSGMKPAIAAASGFNLTTASHNWWDSSENMVFYTMIMHLKVVVGPGNAAATGIMWGVAQQTALRDVTIDAGPAAIGLDVSGVDGYAAYGKGKGHSVGGGGTIEDVTVRGGQTSLRVASSQWALRGLSLSGAASVGVVFEANTNVQLVDVAISSTQTAVQINAGASYVILDATFCNITGGVAIQTGGRGLYLENATATDSSVHSIVDGGPTALPASKAFWQGDAYLGGVKQTSKRGMVASSRLPRRLRPRPTFELPGSSSADPANVLSFGAKGDGVHDDTSAFVQAIASSEVVFVPWGLFRITSTLVLKPHTKIVGEGLSHVFLGNSTAGFNDPANPKPLILAPDDPDAQVWLADLLVACGSGNAGAVSVHWMAGHESAGIWDVHLPFYENGQALLFHLDKGGGGTFANMWLWGADHDVNTDASASTWPSFPGNTCCSAWNNRHGFLATSSGLAWFLGVASEHDVLTAWSLHNSSNIVMVGTPQTEHSPLALDVRDSGSIEIFGVLATAMHADYYHHGLPSLIWMSNNSKTRLVAPNVCNSAYIVNSSEPKMRVTDGGIGFKSAIIAWDDSDGDGGA
eukprot:g3135.t1